MSNLGPQFQHLSWDQVVKSHPEMEEHEYAVNWLAHAHPDDPAAEGSHVHNLSFRREKVDPAAIKYNPAGVDDSRTTRARQGYLQGAQVPPVLLVKRGKSYEVADGHHRAEAAHGLARGGRLEHIDAVVTDRQTRRKFPESY